MRFRTLTVVLIALAGLLALPSAASAGKQRIFSIRISNTPDFLYPNGRSGQASISGDGRVSKYAAYDSDATDIVPERGDASLARRSGTSRTGWAHIWSSRRSDPE